MQKVKATLIDRDGFGIVFETEYPDDAEDWQVYYHWTDGNYGCDCNRSMFLYSDPDKWLECNYDGTNNITLVSLQLEGRELIGLEDLT